MTRKMFAGTNSPMGFVDFFDHIMPPETARRRYFLKGSSGSGKSTLMKAVAAALEGAGHDTELFYCSNDTQSLDAVTAPAIGLLIMDATAPHARDPQICGVMDVLINLGNYLDANKLEKHVDELMTLEGYKKAMYKAAALSLSEIGDCGVHPEPICPSVGRALFASAITPDGVVDLAADCLGDATRRELAAQAELHDMLDKLGRTGHVAECFYCPLNPAEIQYLHVPVLKTAFYVEAADLPQNVKSQLDEAIAKYAAARQIHAKIEDIYVGAMDFDGVDALTERLITEILEMAS